MWYGRCSAFLMVQLSHLYMTSRKTIALSIWTFVSEVMLSRFVIAGGSEVKASACNVGDLGSFPRSGRSPGEGNGNPLQYSCLENPMDRRAWWATVHGFPKSRTRLSDFTFTFFQGACVFHVMAAVTVHSNFWSPRN